MDKKIKTLIIFAAAGCVLIAASAAAGFSQSGELIHRNADEYDQFIEMESENGGFLSAHITADFDSDRTVTSESDIVPEYTVNINTASAYELAALLPGIGEKKAESIVEYRKVTGGFNSVGELAEVEGIGQKLFEQIKPYCVVSDPE